VKKVLSKRRNALNFVLLPPAIQSTLIATVVYLQLANASRALLGLTAPSICAPQQAAASTDHVLQNISAV